MIPIVMGNTYAMVNERKKEWLRQWAKIMLIIEQSVSREERLKQQAHYSKIMPDGTRVLVTRLIQTVCKSNDKYLFEIFMFYFNYSLMNGQLLKVCVRIIIINFNDN